MRFTKRIKYWWFRKRTGNIPHPEEVQAGYEKIPDKNFDHKTFGRRELFIALDYFKYNKTLEQIGDDYNITRERVRQILLKTARRAEK